MLEKYKCPRCNSPMKFRYIRNSKSIGSGRHLPKGKLFICRKCGFKDPDTIRRFAEYEAKYMESMLKHKEFFKAVVRARNMKEFEEVLARFRGKGVIDGR